MVKDYQYALVYTTVNLPAGITQVVFLIDLMHLRKNRILTPVIKTAGCQ